MTPSPLTNPTQAKGGAIEDQNGGIHRAAPDFPRPEATRARPISEFANVSPALHEIAERIARIERDALSLNLEDRSALLIAARRVQIVAEHIDGRAELSAAVDALVTEARSHPGRIGVAPASGPARTA